MAKIEISDLQPISATQAKVRFGDVLHETAVNRKRFVVGRHGKPVCVILSYREYCELVDRRGEPGSRGGP